MLTRKAEVNSSDSFPIQSTHPISLIPSMMVLAKVVHSISMNL